jgi:hypothetical protein
LPHVSRFGSNQPRTGLVAAAATITAAASAAAVTSATATITAATATATVTAAATATTAATTVTATTTTAAEAATTATTAACARFTRASFVDSQSATVKLTAIEVLDRRIGSFLRFHFDKRETARTTGVTVSHNVRRFDSADLGKNFFQILLRHAEGQITDIQTN